MKRGLGRGASGVGQRRGIMLLEVLAALTIFAFAAASAVTLLAQLGDTQQRLHREARTVADQNRLMTAYSLLSRADLDLRLGTRATGAYVVDVTRPTPALYRITIGDSSGVDLVTLLHRPEPARAR